MSLDDDQGRILKDCTERFERLDINYMLTGSMAMLHYAIGRMTRDIVVVLEVSNKDSEAIIKEFEPDYYVPHNPVRDAIHRRRFMFNLLHQETVVKIDCVVLKDNEFQKGAFERRRKFEFGDFQIWTISKNDLILSKLHWAKDTKSEMQMRDVANMLRTEYDQNFVCALAKKLEVQDLFNECLEMLE